MIKIFYVLLIGCITILSGCTATTEGLDRLQLTRQKN